MHDDTQQYVSLQSADGTIRHVDSVQHQNLYATTVPQTAQARMSYGQFQPPRLQTEPLPGPPLTTQPSGTVNPTGNFYETRPKIERVNCENVIGRTILCQMSHEQQQQYALLGKRSDGCDDNCAGSNRHEQQMDVDRKINLQLPTGDVKEHSERLHAANPVLQHFEEESKFTPQLQENISNSKPLWISNLPTPSKNTIKSNKTIHLPDSSNIRPNLQIIKIPKGNLLKVTPPIGQSSSLSSIPKTYDLNQTAQKLKYPHKNLVANANNDGNVAPSCTFISPNCAYSSSIPSSSTTSNDEYNSQSTSTPKIFTNNRSNIHTDLNIDEDYTLQQKLSKKCKYYPELLSDTHNCYTSYPPKQHSNKIETITFGSTTRQLEDIPPLAHLSSTKPINVLETFEHFDTKPSNLQTEPLDLAVVCTSESYISCTHTDVKCASLQFDSVNDFAKNYTVANAIKTNPLDDIHTSYAHTSVKCAPLQLDSVNDFVKKYPLAATATVSISVEPTLPDPTLPVLSNNPTDSMVIPHCELEPIQSTMSSPFGIFESSSANISTEVSQAISTTTISSDTQPTTSVEITPVTCLMTSSPNVCNSVASTSTAVSTYDSRSTHLPLLTPANCPDNIKSHYKLKKTWLQRHTWTEDQRQSGPSTSTASFLQLNNKPVLQCEPIYSKKDIANNANSEVTLELSQSSSSSARIPIPENNESLPSRKRRAPHSDNTISDTSTKASEVHGSATNNTTATNNPNDRQIMVKIPLRTEIIDGENVFFQSDPCLNPTLMEIQNKCRECLLKIEEETNESDEDDTEEEKVLTSQSEIDKIYCRFYKFRLLLKNKEGQLMDAGFPDPYKDIKADDLNLWMPNASCPPKTMDAKVAQKVLQEAGLQFCNLVKEEQKTVSHITRDYPIVWKKAINGVRVMCDVCVTTIFNYHWACQKCGFDVCTDCVRDRLENVSKYPNRVLVTNHHTSSPLQEKDAFNWMICSNSQPHDIAELMFTQMLAGDSLNKIFNHLHTVCTKWKISLECGCPGFPIPEEETNSDDSNNNPVKKPKLDSSARKSSTAIAPNELHIAGCSKDGRRMSIRRFIRRSSNEDLKHFIRTKNRCPMIRNNQLPPRTMTLAESKQMYPTNPHTWLCEGRLLRLLNPKDPTNYSLFREQWIRGQPVLVSGVNKKLKKNLWTPKSFSRDFGELENDLIDCVTGRVVENEKMKVFWDGFLDEKKRMKDSSGKTMLLKLKDWPGSADFSETMPKRFKNLMTALPLKDYTQREGKLNLANRLPDNFLKPDLGPKMYSAYGDASVSRHPKTRLLGTTNLHLDVSDAVNVMAFVSISKSKSEYDRLVEEAYKIIDQSGCDRESKRRARMRDEYPGAVWHIYHASDSDAIRDLLNKVSDERGKKLLPNHDPIHDQSSYLDEKLRSRLYSEYGVRGYAVLQCLGDAILIPAGAPHQVRNLHNCIKVAQDFVSPENLAQCFQLTNEFRDLSSSHTNHEDKLQIKNIMYHAVKDSLSVLMNNEPPPEQRPRGRPRLIKE